MTAPIDTGLGFFRQALALRAYRQEILSADIANASTPGFKAVDVDFDASMGAAMSRGTGSDTPTASPPHKLWLVDDGRQMTSPETSAAGGMTEFVKYQTGGEVTLDGNSVDLDHEK